MALPSIGHILLAQQHKRRDSFTSVADMDLNTLLNTNRPRLGVLPPRNMQYEVPLPLNMNHDMSANAGHYAQNNLYVPNGNNRIKSENGSERGVSPHSSEHSSRYSSQAPQNSIAYQQIASQLTNGMRYPSPSQMTQHNGMMMHNSYQQNGTQDTGFQQQQQAVNGMGAVQAVQHEQSTTEGGRASTGSSGLPKAFACSTCSKGFARRSDLARHGRNFRNARSTHS